MRHELLIGSATFWARAAGDIAAARRRVLVQAMTFEGDAAGQAVAGAVRAAGAFDRRVLVDAYSLHVTNDAILPYAPWQSAEVRQEARATRAMLDELAAADVGVRITNPVGRNPLRFPLRNHKKLLVADDVAYVGGINFSDHNFAWHDLMVRIEDRAAAEFLTGTFAADWSGRPVAASALWPGLSLTSLDGRSNEATLAPVLASLAGARRSIELIGAYPTLPFTDALASAARRGCAVTIFTPEDNNKPLLRDGLLALAGEGEIAVRLLPAMTHAKALLLDGERVLFGSVNFNLASWRGNGDLLADSDDAALVALFERGVFAPARAAARTAEPGAIPAWRRARAVRTLRLADRVLARLRHGPVGAVDWPAAVSARRPSDGPRSPCSSAPPVRSR